MAHPNSIWVYPGVKRGIHDFFIITTLVIWQRLEACLDFRIPTPAAMLAVWPLMGGALRSG